MRPSILDIMCMITCGFIESSELATLRVIMPPGMDG
jgi:hypothetical protein